MVFSEFLWTLRHGRECQRVVLGLVRNAVWSILARRFNLCFNLFRSSHREHPCSARRQLGLTSRASTVRISQLASPQLEHRPQPQYPRQLLRRWRPGWLSLREAVFTIIPLSEMAYFKAIENERFAQQKRCDRFQLKRIARRFHQIALQIRFCRWPHINVVRFRWPGFLPTRFCI